MATGSGTRPADTRLTRLYGLIPILVLLSACATRPPLSGEDRRQAWQAHRQDIAALTQWRLKGRIALRVQDEGWSASLNWRQRRDAYVIRLIAPLGQGTYDLRGDPSAVQLRMPDGRLLFAGDARSLLQQNLGWQVPVTGLVYWIRGLPAPDAAPESLSLDDRGRLLELKQDGWRVRYDGYGLYSGGLSLPQKLTLERQDLRLRILIHDWEA